MSRVTVVCDHFPARSTSRKAWGAGRSFIEQFESRTFLSAVPISSPPVLNSLPGAHASIYLDFNGDGSNGPFSRDSNKTTFSDSEQADIRTIWRIVAEKFSPFNINVTTVPPSGPETHAVITNDYHGGGVAYIGTFPTPKAEAWINGTMSDYEIGVDTAHEVGHTMGLVHQSLYNSSGQKIAEYRPGNGSTGPIMGNPGSSRAVWADGTSSNGPHSIQDDMAIIAGSHHGYTFGYRPSQFGHSIKAATALTFSNKTATESGVIAKTTELDYFSFTTNAGAISFTGSVAANGAMLNLKLELLDSTGEVLKTADTLSLGEKLSMTVAAGKYYIVVASHGSYGDVGQYTLKGTVV
jgi:hypothetical protein